MLNETDSAVAAELDLRHAEAQRAYKKRDVESYRQILSPDLKYTQADGRTIGLDQLLSDVRDQFSRFKDVGSKYERESIERHTAGHVTETLTQTAWAELTVLFFFKRRWEVVRRGEYTWSKTSNGWRMVAVLILHEAVS